MVNRATTTTTLEHLSLHTSCNADLKGFIQFCTHRKAQRTSRRREKKGFPLLALVIVSVLPFLFFHGGDKGSLLILLSFLSSFLDAITRSQSSSFVACFGCAGRGRRSRVLRQHKTSNKKDSRIGSEMTAMKALSLSLSNNGF
ncbi:GLECT [Musa troglodytarum]|uniref:GLECT n=1 Tax=Musa troglodytarum TaxID=320322 RepID=A0A9E7FNZ0_9LILI|nr:GLECT [Musa troglodytarum]URE00259.1 GLECT [Musa troglodytarum]